MVRFLEAICYDRSSSSIYTLLAPTGGVSPEPRKRSRLALTLSEREEISRSIVKDDSMREIAKRLGRSPSTISREIQRNGGLEHYSATQADQSAWSRTHRHKACKLAMYPWLSRIVATKLKQNGSPEQIAGWLK